MSCRSLRSSNSRVFLLPFALSALGAIGTAGCAHEARPAVSAGTVTTSAQVPAPGDTNVVDATGSPSLDPDGPTENRALPSRIADAPAPTPEPAAIPAMTLWGSRYPDAARMLASWSREHDASARRLAQWADHNPEQMHTLVDWAITNQSESIGAFFFDRGTFTELRRVADGDRDAVDELVLWIRRAPRAAKELASHPSGLAFVANHEDELSRARAKVSVVP